MSFDLCEAVDESWGCIFDSFAKLESVDRAYLIFGRFENTSAESDMFSLDDFQLCETAENATPAFGDSIA